MYYEAYGVSNSCINMKHILNYRVFFSPTRFSLGKMLNKNKDRLDMSVDNSLLIIQGHLLNISSYLVVLQPKAHSEFPSILI